MAPSVRTGPPNRSTLASVLRMGYRLRCGRGVTRHVGTSTQGSSTAHSRHGGPTATTGPVATRRGDDEAPGLKEAG